MTGGLGRRKKLARSVYRRRKPLVHAAGSVRCFELANQPPTFGGSAVFIGAGGTLVAQQLVGQHALARRITIRRGVAQHSVCGQQAETAATLTGAGAGVAQHVVVGQHERRAFKLANKPRRAHGSQAVAHGVAQGAGAATATAGVLHGEQAVVQHDVLRARRPANKRVPVLQLVPQPDAQGAWLKPSPANTIRHSVPKPNRV